MTSSTSAATFSGRVKPERGDLWVKSDGNFYKILYLATESQLKNGDTAVDCDKVVIQRTSFKGGVGVKIVELAVFMGFDWEKTRPGHYVPLFHRYECDR